MDSSPNLTLPYIIAAQAQKHVTHNEAIRGLDALVQLMVLEKDISSPPGSPSDGDRYIVGPSPTGAWTGHTAEVAAWQDGVWAFYAPRAGWLTWVADEDKLYVHNGATWGQITVGVGAGASMWGVNATADSTNRLAVASAATLFDNVGNGHQAKINKAAAADTASLLFQTGYSGRAEMGTAGDDDFHFKVSNDGSSWVEALIIDRSTGETRLPHSARFLSGFAAPINCSLAASVASNALTIAIAGADGSTPSAGNPVLIPFRSATASSGAPVWRSLAAALSLTVSSGSTLGAVSGSAFRLWIVVFDDAGTLRLGVINCSTPTHIYPLPETLAGSTAEGGAGGADSAGVIYTGTAVSSKAYRILGYMDWPSGLTTAGTWDTGPTTIKLFGPGDKKPGDTVQTVYFKTTTQFSTTNTSYQDTGVAADITPSSAANIVQVEIAGEILAAAAAEIAFLRLLRGSTALDVVMSASCAAGAFGATGSVVILDAPSTTASISYKTQLKSNGGNTVIFPYTTAGVPGIIKLTEIMG